MEDLNNFWRVDVLEMPIFWQAVLGVWAIGLALVAFRHRRQTLVFWAHAGLDVFLLAVSTCVFMAVFFFWTQEKIDANVPFAALLAFALMVRAARMNPDPVSRKEEKNDSTLD